MKSFNYFAMSLAAAAMVSFASCSSNDDLAGNANGEAKVDGFYMTLSVQTPKDNGGSRTAQQKEPNKVTPTDAENNVSNGTLYLVDANGKVAFSKYITITENGAKAIEVPVQNVAVGATYKAYFLANVKAEDTNPLTGTFQVADANKFAGDYAKDKAFAMFNQNDATQKADVYTVQFTDVNRTSGNAAKVMKDDKESPIIIERLVARVDKPTSATAIASNVPSDASKALERAYKDAKDKVKEFELTNYAISYAANSSYIMQQWNNNWTDLAIPTDLTGFKYFQEKNAFGGDYDYQDGGFNMNENNYIFENNNTMDKATAMYFEYKVTLKDYTGADFTEVDGESYGTFYRYNGVIYTSFKAIFDAYNNVEGLFGGKKADELATALKKAINDETELAKFRETYNIEVFKAGKTYYKTNIHDEWLKKDNIQRNTVYKLKVNNIFNVGAQVPNGKPDDNDRFFLDVTVTVNPWVLSTQDVDLK